MSWLGKPPSPIVWGIALALLLVVSSRVAAQFGTLEAEQPVDLRQLFALGGIGEEAWSQFRDGEELSAGEIVLSLRLLSRLESLDRRRLSESALTSQLNLMIEDPAIYRGNLFHIAGRVQRAEKLMLGDELRERFQHVAYYRCTVQCETEVADVMVTHIPSYWPLAASIDEPITADAVFLKTVSVDGRSRPLLVSSHLSWRPDRGQLPGVTAGHLLLAELGMDVGLLDEVRHRRPFVGPRISNERGAFYSMLAAVGRARPELIEQRARESFAEYRQRWLGTAQQLQEDLKQHRDRQHTRREDEPPQVGSSSPDNSAALEKRWLLAAEVIRQTDEGRFSVAPLFNEPARHAGSLLELVGTARRAVRIDVANPTEFSGSASTEALDRYFELDLFTADSQNNPVVVCVRDIPAGFPTGDNISEGVRVAAFFLKNWQYDARSRVGRDGQPAPSERRLAPLLIGHAPARVVAGVAKNNDALGMWLGVGFLLALLAAWWGIWRYQRGDREFSRHWGQSTTPSPEQLRAELEALARDRSTPS